MKSPGLVLTVAALGASAFAQTAPPPAVQMCNRASQLIEAGGVAVPGLARAGAPIAENVKQACLQIKARPDASQPAYDVLMNLRAYVALYEALPKPDPFPAIARAQFSELRDLAGNFDGYFRRLLDTKESQIHSSDRDDMARFREDNLKLAPPAAAKPRVVFLGDTTASLWRLNEYFPDRDFVNRAIEGQIVGQILGRIKQDAVGLRPEALVIMVGTFDVGQSVPIDTIEGQFETIAQIAAANKIKPIFVSLPPVNDYKKSENPAYERTLTRPLGTLQAVNTWLSAYCKQHGYPFADIYAALVDEHGMLGEDLSDDGLLPNSKGYRLIAPVVVAAIDKALGPGAGIPVGPAAAPAKPTAPPAASKKR